MATVTICTAHFETIARNVAGGAGMPGLAEVGLVFIPHPLAELAPPAVESRALDILPQLERLLGLEAGDG